LSSPPKPNPTPPQTAAEICARYPMKKEAQALLQSGMTPRDFLDALRSKGQYLSAIEFMAHAMPPRASIWWGCLCLQHALGANLAPQDWKAFQAAAIWVLWPTERYRLAAQAPAQAAGVTSPAGCLAQAAFAAGATGPVPISPGTAVANAVKLATVKGEPARIADNQRLYVELGTGVAEGRFRWPKT
jgi:hypothetical protein